MKSITTVSLDMDVMKWLKDNAMDGSLSYCVNSLVKQKMHQEQSPLAEQRAVIVARMQEDLKKLDIMDRLIEEMEAKDMAAFKRKRYQEGLQKESVRLRMDEKRKILEETWPEIMGLDFTDPQLGEDWESLSKYIIKNADGRTEVSITDILEYIKKKKEELHAKDAGPGSDSQGVPEQGVPGQRDLDNPA